MVRRIQNTDIKHVADIWLDTNIRVHDFIPVQYWNDNFESVKEMIGQAEVYVYEAGNKVCGFIGLKDDYIAGIFIRSDVQSRGIGKQLLDYVKGIKKRLSLNVYQKNTRAVKFYKREKFEIQQENMDEATGEKEYSMIWKR